MPDSVDPIAELRASVSGRVIDATSPAYERARRVWNGMIDRRPSCIVEAASDDDIAPTLAVARSSGLPLAIRGGGHNVAGNGTVDGGIVLDLGRLNGVAVQPEDRLVRIAAGATLGDVDRATEPHGLAVPIGVVSGTGIAGLTLGGGVGWMTRRYGLTIDNLLEAEVVLANGRHVRASETEHPDLFWGLRGGGGNFGVVTSFTFRAYPHGPDVFVGTLIYRRERWAEALRAWASWTADLPDELTSIITAMVPPTDWELGDEPVLFVGFAWAGPGQAAGEALVDRLRAACPPDTTVLEPTTWLAFQSGFDAAMPKGSRAYWRNAWFRGLGEVEIETLADWAGRQAAVGTAVDLHHMAGAFGRVPEDATAFPDRSARYWLNIYGFWTDAVDDGPRTAWVKGVSDAMRPHAMAVQYVNFMGQDAGDPLARALSVYGPDKLARLREVKRRYDPENRFRINHNIPPADRR